MITKKDLQEAIAECQGQKNPNANTCIKLAAFLTIKEHMYPEDSDKVTSQYPIDNGYSYGKSNIIDYTNDTEFSNTINGMNSDDVWPVIDELMSTIQVMNRRLYESVMRRIRN